ncbi:hypothetical protein B9Z19DRAFT_65899 [Tuber borchii]|uniref:Uncharacterized protein n=1 Tax=Tuber borchii TaxID=42251 RepID=A0A2T6ZSP5_TUBBO|nr:hypothetical protein B9Z19DRAFT_65899 [Tuber borchii]
MLYQTTHSLNCFLFFFFFFFFSIMIMIILRKIHLSTRIYLSIYHIYDNLLPSFLLQISMYISMYSGMDVGDRTTYPSIYVSMYECMNKNPPLISHKNKKRETRGDFFFWNFRSSAIKFIL